MRMTFDQFGGEAPRLAAARLPAHLARTAREIRTGNGQLRAYRQFADVLAIAPAQRQLYRFGVGTETPVWLTFDGPRHILRAPIRGDTTHRTVLTGGPYPQQTDATRIVGNSLNALRLGVPAPASAPLLATVGEIPTTDPQPAANTVTRAYVITFVNGWGEESAPSPPTAVLDVHANQTAQLSALPLPPAGPYAITGKRIYRAETGVTGTDLLFVAEVGPATLEYHDQKLAVDLGGPLETQGFDMLPDAARGLLVLPNGIGAAFVGNEVCFSAPYLLYAWPVKQRKAMPFEIVGIGSFQNSVVVCTAGSTHVVTGYDPASMSDTRLDLSQFCVSARSIVSVGGYGVMYAAPDGLVSIGSSNGVLTAPVVSRDEWQALKPESMIGFEHEGRYFGFFDTGTRKGGFVFNPFDPQAGLVMLDFYAQAAFRDPLDDALYLVPDGASKIVRFDAGPALRPYVWRSGDTLLPAGRALRFVRVRADSYASLTLKVYADGVLRVTKAITSGAVLRIPDVSGKVFSVELAGTDTVDRLELATTRSELAA